MRSEKIRLAFPLLLLAFVLSCSSPGTPPSPPAELPSSFPFPEEMGINVDKILAEGSGSESLTKREVGSGGEFSDEISIGGRMADEVIEELDSLLEIFGDIDVSIGEDITTLETTSLKMDFAPYDFDGDGIREDCSGHTGALPICFRVWLNNERLMAGLFDEYPSEESPGKGEFRVVDSEEGFGEGSGEGSAIGVVYNHSDEENKSTDIFSISPAGDFLTEYRHISLSEVGPESSAKKTLNLQAKQMGLVNYLGEWIDDEDYWSGKVFISDQGDSDENIPCAQISTGNSAAEALCEALGITVEGIPFNELPTEVDTALPDDFPDTPTF